MRKLPGAEYVGTYKFVLACFSFSLLFDTGSNGFRLAGLGLPTIFGGGVTLLGLLHWRPPKDVVLQVAFALIIGWVGYQVIVCGSVLAGIRMMSVLMLALVIGGNATPPWDMTFQLRIFFLPILLIMLSFYLGFWHSSVSIAGKYGFGGFNSNHLALVLCAGAILAAGLGMYDHSGWKWLGLISCPLFIVPIWFTGSRKGLILALVCLAIQTGFFLRFKKTLLLVSLGGVLAIGYLVFGDGEALFHLLEQNELFYERYINMWGESVHFRSSLILAGIEAFLQKPWVGFGIDAPHSTAWLKEYIGITNNGGLFVGTHNGWIDYLIMGGIPLLLLYLVVYARLLSRLFFLALRQERQWRMYASTAFSMNLIFCAFVFFGDVYWKLGWWMYGFGLFVLRIYEEESEPRIAIG